MKQSIQTLITSHRWRKLIAPVTGFCALAWFLLRVIPKPSRATYPCQRAAFPVAGAFVAWSFGSLGGLFSVARLRRLAYRYRAVVVGIGAIALIGCAVWVMHTRAISAAEIATRYDYTPKLRNSPMGVARGINPGRVVWARDPQAARWSGHIESATDQWWMDANTNQQRVDALLSVTLKSLTDSATDEDAWLKIFAYYNQRARGLRHRGYQPGEVVAVKVNLNNSSRRGAWQYRQCLAAGSVGNGAPTGESRMCGPWTSSSMTRAATSIRRCSRTSGVIPGTFALCNGTRPLHPYPRSRLWRLPHD